MFAPLAYTKTYAMAAAAGLSVTLVPVLMGYFIRGRIVAEHRNPLNRLLIWSYGPLIGQITRHPWRVVLVTAALVVVGFWPVNRLGSEFIPDLNEGDLMYIPTTFPGISIGKAQDMLQQTDKLIRTVPEVKSVFGKIGRAETATDPAPLTMIETVIQLKPVAEWRDGVTIDDIKRELNQRVQLPGLTNAWVWPIMTRIDMLATGIKTPVGIKVAGPDLGVIQQIGQDIEAVLKQVPGTASAFAERVAGGRYVTVDILRDQASRYGLNTDDVQDIVRTAIGGIRVEGGPPMIKSENARLNGWIFVDIEGVDLGTYVAAAKQAVTEEVELPAAYSLNWSGQYEYMERAKKRLAIVVPITLVTIILLLFLNFRSMAEVLIIMGTLPTALIGGIWLLYLLDYHVSVAVGVGFIALAGVAVEIGVVMLVYLKQALSSETLKARREQRPLAPENLVTAVTNDALMRLRPIMMTVATIIAGLLPIMLGSGTGSEVMRRIAAPMVGGMVSATLLTLALIPAIFLLWQKRLLRKNFDSASAELTGGE